MQNSGSGAQSRSAQTTDPGEWARASPAPHDGSLTVLTLLHADLS